jgi:hypothetical protein
VFSSVVITKSVFLVVASSISFVTAMFFIPDCGLAGAAFTGEQSAATKTTKTKKKTL